MHDDAYARGGTSGDRLRADLVFALELLATNMPVRRVELYLLGVRRFGWIYWPGGDVEGGPTSLPVTLPPLESP